MMIDIHYAFQGWTRALAGIFLCVCLPASVTAKPDALERGFRSLPPTARPWVYWHWMNGNVTKESITLDLEAMKRVGIGGVHIFDVDQDTPVLVDKPAKYFSPAWFEVKRHAAAECDRLGIEMAIQGSPGWSTSGGPWVTPDRAMQKLVWSETRVAGPQKFSARLPEPPSSYGPFLDVPVIKQYRKLPPGAPSRFYRDAAVLAFPAPARAGQNMAESHPRVTSNASGFDAAKIVDGDPKTSLTLQPPRKGDMIEILVAFDQPFEARFMTLLALGHIPAGELQVSDDGTTFRKIGSIARQAQYWAAVPKTVAFQQVSARFFRLRMNASYGGKSPFELADFNIGAQARVNRFEDKAGFSVVSDGYEALATPPAEGEGAFAAGDVVDLSSRLTQDGHIEWDVPPGNWTILRFGHSPTGRTNTPAPPEATGLEIDKLSSDAVTAYFDGFMGPLATARFGALLLDSWEAGHQNWTPAFVAEFRKRRGYDPTPYLPAMAGFVVGGAEISDRFLWDARRTIADLVADSHYGTLRDLLHRRGMGLHAEAVGIWLPMVADQLQAKGRTDVPMGEFWLPSPGEPLREISDCKEAASAGHIYGNKIIAAEAFTATAAVPAWSETPFAFKRVGDLHFAAGINRMVLHSYVAQPFPDRKPGFTLGSFGSRFSRHLTWWEQSAAWIAYLTRSQFLLQQGLFVADVLYFYGEGAPMGVPPQDKIDPPPPRGYAYDFTNAEVLLARTTAKDGRIVLPDGISYRVLVMPKTDALSVEILEKVREFIKNGVTVVGNKPRRSPGLGGYPQSDAEVRRLADEIWGAQTSPSGAHRLGAGKVIWGKPLAGVLGEELVTPDFEFTSERKDANLVYLHRRTADADIYFVSNQNDRPESGEATFRVDGKAPELWRPDTGQIERPAGYSARDGCVSLPLDLDPAGSLFVVFRAPGRPKGIVPPPTRTMAANMPPTVPILGPWQVSFPAGLGAPDHVTLDKLMSWTDHAAPGVKFFSGTATYVATVELPPVSGKGTRRYLDLGEVREIAEVSLNGKSRGVLWKPPFRVDVTGAARPGLNKLEVRVTNLWPNRLIGDQNLPEDKRSTWTTHNPYKKDSPLLASGLLGPVRVVVADPANPETP